MTWQEYGRTPGRVWSLIPLDKQTEPTAKTAEEKTLCKTRHLINIYTGGLGGKGDLNSAR